MDPSQHYPKGYSIRTYRLILDCDHPAWFLENQKRYRAVQQFYYEVLLEDPELLELGSQQILRELERLTVSSHSGREAGRTAAEEEAERIVFGAGCEAESAETAEGAEPIISGIGHEAGDAEIAVNAESIVFSAGREVGDAESVAETAPTVFVASYEAARVLPQIPAYFRRSAINAVTAAVKSIRTRSGGRSLKTEFQNSVVFYQRMYKNFTGRRITLHIWNGEAWVWEDCRLHGGKLPDPQGEGVKWMSPSVVCRKDHIFLHVPVREPVEDSRKLKQRIKDREPVCAVQFMNTDCFAALCVLDAEGNQTAAGYVKGGAQYVHRCREILNRIGKSHESCGSRGQPKADQKYWMKLKHQKEYWAHKVSREILDFCGEHGAKILTWEEYEPGYSRAVLKKAGNWSALHLSSRVKEYLNYKAWQEGILIAPVKSFQIKERKFEPGEKNIQRARILGQQCLKNLGKRML